MKKTRNRVDSVAVSAGSPRWRGPVPSSSIGQAVLIEKLHWRTRGGGSTLKALE
jgi:hypothetical protein